MNAYLARTAPEMGAGSHLPCAWMACHFAPYGNGLSNLPPVLPDGSLVILNDSAPIAAHDPEQIAFQLESLPFAPAGLLLDLQRPEQKATKNLVTYLLEHLSYPIAVTPAYAQGHHCPVFLDPPPLHKPLSAHLAPWKGREIWLEAALCRQDLTITRDGCQISPLLPWEEEEFPHTDPELFCQYRLEVARDAAHFHLSRGPQLLGKLLQAAQSQGISTFVGLYQQLKGCLSVVFG